MEYRLYYGDTRVEVAAIEARLDQLSRTTGVPIGYRRTISAFLREERNRLAGSSDPTSNKAE